MKHRVRPTSPSRGRIPRNHGYGVREVQTSTYCPPSCLNPQIWGWWGSNVHPHRTSPLIFAKALGRRYTYFHLTTSKLSWGKLSQSHPPTHTPHHQHCFKQHLFTAIITICGSAQLYTRRWGVGGAVWTSPQGVLSAATSALQIHPTSFPCLSLQR